MRSSFNPSFRPFNPITRKPAAESAPEEVPVFSPGETVMHPSEGICIIEEIKNMDFSGTARAYYTLRPAAEKSSSVVYLPVVRGNGVLRPLLTRETILSMIRQAAKHESLWIADNKQRKEAFTRILSEGNHVKILRMIQDLHEQHILREQEGKKVCVSDETILAEAERRLHLEFSHVLRMNLEETTAFIRQNLGV